MERAPLGHIVLLAHVHVNLKRSRNRANQTPIYGVIAFVSRTSFWRAFCMRLIITGAMRLNSSKPSEWSRSQYSRKIVP